jgi:cell division protein FtsQ
MARPGLRPVRRRRRANWPRLLLTLAVLAAVAGAWQLERSPLLRVQHVEVHGGPAALWLLSGIKLDEPIWSLDTEAAARTLLRRAPYLRSALVLRRWPQTAEIDVGYRVAMAAVVGPGGRLFGVDDTGRVLTPLGSATHFAVLGGVPAAAVVRYRDLHGAGVHAALALMAAFTADGFPVSQVVAGSPLAVYLPSGTEVLWPQGANTASTLRELQAVLQALRRQGNVAASIDLRVVSRPLVVLRQ